MAANNLDCRNGGTDGSDVTQEPSGYEPDELPLLHPAIKTASFSFVSVLNTLAKQG